MNKEITHEGVTGKLNCFIIEPMVSATAEYYLCIHSLREVDEILFYHEVSHHPITPQNCTLSHPQWHPLIPL